MRKKILTISIAAILTATVNSGVMAFDSVSNNPAFNVPVNMNAPLPTAPLFVGIVPAPTKPAAIIVQTCKPGTPSTSATGYCRPNEAQFSGCPAAYVGNNTVINGTTHAPVPANADLIVNASDRAGGGPLLSNWTGVSGLTPGGGVLTRRGDALIFPLFAAGQRANTQGVLQEQITCANGGVVPPPSSATDKGWSTEFVVRNTSRTNAIVAKVTFLSQIDSEEILDFNVYLSAYDVVRFKIEKITVDGSLVTRVTSTDGSVPYFVSKPENGASTDQVIFASEKNPFVRDLPEDVGYAVVYGMGQATNRNRTNGSSQDLRYDHEHQQLFNNYRAELDVCRPNWRRGHRNAMAIGTYIPFERNATNVPFFVPAPNVPVSCLNPTTTGNVPLTGAVPGNYFGDVLPNLTGTVRVYNEEVGKERDMLLPATTVWNFTTPNNKILYAEGEIASLQDRRIYGNVFTANDGTVVPGFPTLGVPNIAGIPACVSNATTSSYTYGATNLPVDWAYYDEAGIQRDANPFLVRQTVYKFAKLPDNVSNSLNITQPYKRILVQMGNDDRYWKQFLCDDGTPDVIDGVNNFGGIIMRYVIYDEDEHRTARTFENSPFGQNEGSWPNEVQAFRDLEKNIRVARFTDENTGRITTVLREMTAEEISEQNAGTADYTFNGFGLVTLIGNEGAPLSANPGNNAGLGVPAIVTQWVATNVGGKGQLNWIYSETR